MYSAARIIGHRRQDCYFLAARCEVFRQPRKARLGRSDLGRIILGQDNNFHLESYASMGILDSSGCNLPVPASEADPKYWLNTTDNFSAFRLKSNSASAIWRPAPPNRIRSSSFSMRSWIRSARGSAPFAGTRKPFT